MAKTVSPFVFSGIVLAAVEGARVNGAFVQAIVLARQPLRGTPSEAQVFAVETAMAEAFHENALQQSTCKTYQNYARILLLCPMSHLLSACEEGDGITGVLQRVRAQRPASDAPKRGRPAAQGAGKTTAAKDSGAVDPMIEAGIITQHVVHARSAMAQCLKWKENGRGLSTAQVDEIKEHYAAIAAVLGSLIAKPAKPAK